MSDIPEILRRASSYAQSPTTDGQGPRINVLSSKVTSVLSSSFADTEIRDSLETLDARGIINSAETRRNIRLDVQKEIIQCNGEILRDFGQVAEQLKHVGTALRSLQSTCAALRQHVTTAHNAANPLLKDASSLFTEKQQVETKQILLGAFTTHFLLTPQEHLILTSSGEPVTDAFFAALVKAKRIHHDSQILLGGQSQHLGLEIIESSTRDINTGYQKLFRWTQREFKLLDLENPHMSAGMRRALRVLAERPTLFQICLTAFAEARERALRDAFAAALTGQMPPTAMAMGEVPKPIEYLEEEPLRYVGDMLAWVHSAAVSEREALEGLFVSDGDEISRSIQAGLESEPWLRVAAEEDENGASDAAKIVEAAADYFSPQTSAKPSPQLFDGRRALAQLIDHSLAGVSNLLRQRISALIRTYSSPVLTYKTANLLLFYLNIFSRLISPPGSTSAASPTSSPPTTANAPSKQTSTFTTSLLTLHTTALDHFRTTIRSHITSTLSTSTHTPHPDLTPPDFLTDALDELTELLKSYDTTHASSANPTTTTHDPPLTLLLSEALDPYLSACATLARTLLPPAGDILAVNSLQRARDVLTALTGRMRFLAPKVAALDDEIEERALALVNYLHGFLVRRSGLQPLLAAVAQVDEAGQMYARSQLEGGGDADKGMAGLLQSLAAHPAFQPQRLSDASQALDHFLPSALMDAAEQVRRVNGVGLAREVAAEAAERFCVDFEGLEEWLGKVDEVERRRAESEGGEDGAGEGDGGLEPKVPLRLLFPRTAEEIRILLS